ncbi:MAG: DEAD/DEAH box helicase family protein [Lentisphaerae bacterium]|nr:DEAD/DEAH box helicase family protein [Lentisphaerota bacterium]
MSKYACEYLYSYVSSILMTNAGITQKLLIDWGGKEVFKNAESIIQRGFVLEAEYDHPYVRGTILWNNRPLKTSFKILGNGMIESRCPCRDNVERGLVCPHIIAIGLMLVKRATDPLRNVKYQEEIRRASRLSNIDESQYITRVSSNTPGALPAKVVVQLDHDWINGINMNHIPITCAIEYRKTALPADEVPRDIPLSFSKQDEALLFVLEDIAEGPVPGKMKIGKFDFVNLIKLHSGRTLPCCDSNPITVNATRMTTFLNMDLDRETGELILIAHTELPFMKPTEFAIYIIAGNSGWVFGANNLWPLENVLPEPYHPIYREPVVLPRSDVLRFLRQELPVLSKNSRVESDVSLDLFNIDPATPEFRLLLQGSPASLSATLYARYNDIELVACKPAAHEYFAIPDPADLMSYQVRNYEAETLALKLLAPSGLFGETGDNLAHIADSRGVLNFLGTHLPVLRRHGWLIELKGRIAPYMETLAFVTPVVRIDDKSDAGWFEVGFDFEDSGGQSISSADIQLAMRKGESYLQRNGNTILIDTDAVGRMQDVFSDCAGQATDRTGHFRVSNVYSAFVKSSLDALDGVDIEPTRSWMDRATRQNRSGTMEPLDLPEYLDNLLRPYQKQGVQWLRFLEQQGFCGLLADEMGLGKTVQTLAWLQLPRNDTASRNLPALVVSPTSLVENWAEEAARFVPHLTVINLTGPDRHEKWSAVKKANIALTSYAILRRDLERYLTQQFSVVIMDEAQHIKNKSTQNALSAKQIRTGHKLVLTGTPVENGVADIWSIMDFLMPNYLGSHDHFRQNYEIPIARGDEGAMNAQIKLKRKLHPFLLRRRKTEVAKDLPDKIEKIASCPLSPDQRAVYYEFLRTSQKKVTGMVSQKGFNKSRMEILVVLMRLRQICCHLELLDLPGLSAKQPSAKMELFFELLDEAVDSGHRILVFSQFVSMLTILRRELEQRDLSHCYLDGQTKDRTKVVHKFNTERNIPLFLISLKAGGTGLNLTGADMVVHFDPWWNPAVENQATDRAHRIGQKKTVYSVKLITRDTVEEKVLAMQRKKKSIIDSVVESDEAAITSFSWDDIQQFLEMK